jgi:hypothetical protein
MRSGKEVNLKQGAELMRSGKEVNLKQGAELMRSEKDVLKRGPEIDSGLKTRSGKE